MSQHSIEMITRQTQLDLDLSRVREAVVCVLTGEGIEAAEISIAVVENAEIRRVNRQYLEHDFATDVISFSLGEPAGPLEGDLMVSAEMAVEQAARYGWSPLEELLLYVIHGTLHLAGYDDLTDEDRAVMRRQETHYLQALGVQVTDATVASSGDAKSGSVRSAEGGSHP